MKDGKRRKVLVIGIDGGTFRIIDRLAAEGKLPHFKSMFQSGSRGVLESTLPPITAPAWTSFATGKNPGKHGVFNFMTFKKGTYDIELINSTNIKSRQIWHYFHDNKVPFVSLNVPMTYPPLDLNGIIVSGLLSPPGKIIANQPAIKTELEGKEYMVDVPDSSGITQRGYYETVKQMSRKRFETACQWIKEKQWDFFMTVFVGSDRIQHKLWNKMEWLDEYYISLDGYVRDLTALAGEDTHVIIMSDHGFTGLSRTFHTNEWLRSAGLLEYSSGQDEDGLKQWGDARKEKARKKGSLAYRFLKKIGFTAETRKKLFPDWLWNFLLRIVPRSMRGVVPNFNVQIDWSKTRAYGNTSRPIYVNLEGREARGIVKPGEQYQSVVKEIKEGLLNLTDTNTGKKPFTHVYTRDEIYNGPYADAAPDVVFHSDDFSYCLRGGKSDTGKPFKDKPALVSDHDHDGIFMMTGPAVQPGSDLGHISIMDVAPTILHIMGIPVPDDMDGRVLKESFLDGSGLSNDVDFQKASGYSVETQKAITDEEDEELQKRLKDLGYLS